MRGDLAYVLFALAGCASAPPVPAAAPPARPEPAPTVVTAESLRTEETALRAKIDAYSLRWKAVMALENALARGLPPAEVARRRAEYEAAAVR